MTPITSTVPSTTARRRAATHRATQGTVTAYLRDLSAAAQRPATVRRRVSGAVSAGIETRACPSRPAFPDGPPLS